MANYTKTLDYFLFFDAEIHGNLAHKGFITLFFDFTHMGEA